MAALQENHNFLFDEDDEPLFADDLDDDDISNLPPPMPTLEELSAHDRAGGRAPLGQTSIPGYDMGDGTANQNSDSQGPPLKKRKPILTLKIDRIFSDKGLNYLHTEFPKLRFKGKGHELSDLKHLMKNYEHWANMLYPKMTFRDLTDRIEVLAKKMEFKTNLIRMRRQQARGGTVTPPLSDNEDAGNPPTDPNPSHGPESQNSSLDHQPHPGTTSLPHASTPPLAPIADTPSHNPVGVADEHVHGTE